MVNGLNWQCCLAGSSKTAPRILIFSIAIDANYSYQVKNSEIWVHAFFKHNNSFIAAVPIMQVDVAALAIAAKIDGSTVNFPRYVSAPKVTSIVVLLLFPSG